MRLRRASFIFLVLNILLALIAIWPGQLPVEAATAKFNNPGFASTWNRVDKAFGEIGQVGRSYTWGPVAPGAENLSLEYYNGGTRLVEYFDKARMEVNNPNGNPNDLFYVTTGLLVKELVTGQRQDGDNSFTQLAPSTVQVAGDPNQNGGNPVAPTYASFRKVGTFSGGENGQPAATGSPIKARIDKAGNVSDFQPPEIRTDSAYDDVTRHNIADVFVNFANQRGPVWNGQGYSDDAIFFGNPTYVLGRPVTEPYWTQAVVAGQEKDVLVQLFERRVLTYTPSNPKEFKVEMGNVGQHYYQWRYVLNGVSEARYSRLAKGINLSHWFAQDYLTADRLQNYDKAQDFQLIRNLGLQHVRLPLDPALLFNEGQPENLNAQNLGYLDRALDMIMGQQLAVIVDLHPQDDFKRRLALDDGFMEAVARFWRVLARHLSQRNPELLFMEALNEPAFQLFGAKDPAQRAAVVQQRLLAAMREGAPNHTLIADAGGWSKVEDLEATPLLADSNVVYDFHFYDPFPFTHQGATWSGDNPRYWRNLPYPSSPEACQGVLPQIGNDAARAEAAQYCNERWDSAKLESLIARAGNWAQARQVRLTANEFGVLRWVSPGADRNNWIRDTRSLLEKYHIGWAMWDYVNEFGLVVQGSNGQRQLDTETARALGLSVPNPS